MHYSIHNYLIRTLIFVICLVYGGSAFGQLGKNRVYYYNDSVSNVINNYRAQVYQHLKNGTPAAIEINYGYESMKIAGQNTNLSGTMAKGTGQHYLDLNEIESIHFIQHSFDEILNILRNNSFELEGGVRIERIDPRAISNTENVVRNNRFGEDSLGYEIGMILLNYKPHIIRAIMSTNLSDEEKDFLQLYLNYKILNLWDVWLFSKDKHEIKEDRDICDSLDSFTYKNAKEFLVQYPNSEFNSYISTFMLTEYKIKNWAVGLDPLYLGTLVPLGNLGDYMKIPPLYANFGLRIYYKNVFTNLMGGVSATGLHQNVFQDTTWSKGFSILTFDFGLGYCFDIGKRFTISPLVGVRSVINLGPKFNGKTTTFVSQSPWTFGFEFAYGGLSKSRQTVSSRFSRSIIRDGVGLKIMYQNPKYEKVIPALDGGLLTVTLGINMAIFGVNYED